MNNKRTQKYTVTVGRNHPKWNKAESNTSLFKKKTQVHKGVDR